MYYQNRAIILYYFQREILSSTVCIGMICYVLASSYAIFYCSGRCLIYDFTYTSLKVLDEDVAMAIFLICKSNRIIHFSTFYLKSHG